MATFVSGWGLPTNLDPHQVYDVPMQTMMLNAYDNLYRYQNDPPEIVPWLAESHTVSDDGLTWEFKLRPGDQVPRRQRADRRGRGLQLPPRAGAGAGAGRRVPPDPEAGERDGARPADGALQARDRLCAVLRGDPQRLHRQSAASSRRNEKDGDWGKTWLASNGAGSGAYKIVPDGYRPLEYLDMEIFDGHFLGWERQSKARCARSPCRPTKETSTRILALLNGTIDWTDTNLPADQVDQINASKIAHVQKDIVMRTFVIRMNNTKPPFDNINARKAFAHAFNYMGFINGHPGRLCHARSLCRCRTRCGASRRMSRATTTI